MRRETIFALSSPTGRSAVAVVRLSGPAAMAAARRLAGGSLPAPRTAGLRRLRDVGDGRRLDQALVIPFPGPASFTGEDMVEVHLHGGPAVVAAVLETLGREVDLRPAEAGEFTRRAFDNNKLDLSEVEGLADLIAAETEAQRRQALRQMEGGLSRHLEAWRERLLQARALSEAMIDFSDEDLPDTLGKQLDHYIYGLIGDVTQYIDDKGLGERLRDGLHAAIVGPPNAGKSSLLNALLRREAAIVADQAGTTRDVIEAHLDLAGYPVTLADTAGLRSQEAQREANENWDEVEREGMRRARRRATSADFVIAVFEPEQFEAAGHELFDLLDERATIVLNKVDLYPDVTAGPVPKGELPEAFREYATFRVSAKEGPGLSALIDHLRGETLRLFAGTGEAPAITRARHRRALEDCRDALRRSKDALLPELVAEDLRHALTALDRITGRSDIEEVLDRIFQEFCIGK